MIDRLEMFIALAKERHFGRAAETMGITQPSLSAAIRQLEQNLGVQLVWRGSRFQGLTPEGQRVLDWAQKIVGDTRTMRDEMRALRSGVSGKLRIGVIPTALPMVARLTAPFVERNPNTRITVLSRTSAEILAGIGSLDLDAGITYLDNEPLGRMAEVPLYRESYRLLVTAGHPLAGLARITWAEASALPLCLLTEDMQNRRIVARHLAEAGAEAAPQIDSNSTIALVGHVATGHWASILPQALTDLITAGAGLVALPMIAPEAHHLVGLIAAHREPHTPVLAALLDQARRVAQV